MFAAYEYSLNYIDLYNCPPKSKPLASSVQKLVAQYDNHCVASIHKTRSKAYLFCSCSNVG